MKTIVTVCARGGSKGVLGKNLKPILGLPLICHTLRQAKACGLFDVFAVSSDSPEILQIAKSEGFLEVNRPPAMAGDTAAKVPVIRHCVETVEKYLSVKFDYCVDLDCTSPLRELDDLAKVMELIQKKNVSNVITAMPARRSPYFNLIEMNSEGEISLAKRPETAIIRRQDAPQCFDMNASIYAWKRNILRDHDTLFLKGTALHVMPEERSIDIDSELDFEIVKLIMEKKVNYE